MESQKVRILVAAMGTFSLDAVLKDLKPYL